MIFNWYFFPTVLLAVMSAFATRKMYALVRRRNPVWGAWLAVWSGFCAIPALLYAAYYLHWFDNTVWFYQLRSEPGTEILAGAAGALAGVLWEINSPRTDQDGENGIDRESHKQPLSRRIASAAILFTGLILLTAAPFIKQILFPLPAEAMTPTWDGPACMQSTASTCGPASAASILRSLGVQGAGESEVAKEAFATRRGTECWYLARAVRKYGFEAEFKITHDGPDAVRLPAAAGVRMPSGEGHFIALLSRTEDGLITGVEPLSEGLFTMPAGELVRHFQFTGFYMEIHPI